MDTLLPDPPPLVTAHTKGILPHKSRQNISRGLVTSFLVIANELKLPPIHRQRRKDDVHETAPAAAMVHFAATSGVVPKPIDVNRSMMSWRWLGVTGLVEIEWRSEECHLHRPVVKMFFHGGGGDGLFHRC